MQENYPVSRSKPLVTENTPDLTLVPALPLAAAPQRAAARPKGDSGQGFTLAFILNALRRWWFWATPAALVLAVGGVALVWVLFEKKYEADSWLRVDERQQIIAFPSGGEPTLQSFLRTQTELIRSPMVLGPVVKRPEVAQIAEIQGQLDPIAWLGKQIKVTSVGGSELFRIMYSGNNAENAKTIVTAVTESYFKLRDSSESERSQKVIELLEKERDSWAQKVTRLRQDLRELAKQVTGRESLAPKPEADAVEKRPLADMQTRLIAIQVEGAELDARIQVAQENLKGKQDSAAPQGAVPEEKRSAELLTLQEREYRDTMVGRALDEHPEIQRRAGAILAREAQLSEVEAALQKGKNDPLYRRRAEELQRDRQALEQFRKQIRPNIEKQVEVAMIAHRTESENTLAAKQLDDLARLQTERKTRQVMEERLKAEYDSELKKVKQASGDTLELEFKRDELARAERVFELIAQRTLQLQTEQRAPARVTLLRMAEVPAAPIEAVPWKKMAMVGLMCLCLPFGLAVLWERLLRRVGGSDDLEQVMHLTVLGEIARLPQRAALPGNRPSTETRLEMQVFQESMDSLRTHLTLSEELRDSRFLAITSASSSEGKTSVAAQLALSLARASGESVLLIDGDMRSPDIHRTFGIPLEPGLAKVLKQECSVEDAIVTTWSQNVHLLPAGKLSGSPHRLLGSGAWKVLLSQVPAKYRYVIIDTPPVLAASEALVLAKAADATLICAMRDVSRMDQVKLVYDRLVGVGGHPAGVVLNGVPTRSYAYRYGSYT